MNATIGYNNTFQSILLNTELLLSDPHASCSQVKLLKKLKDSVEPAVLRVRELMEFTGNEKRKPIDNFKNFNINELNWRKGRILKT